MERKKKKKNPNKEIMRITYIFVGLFFLMLIYFAYFQVFEAKDAINNPRNRRQDIFAKHVVRGEILSSSGEVLATTITDEDGKETREYPYGNLFAHVVGIDGHGKYGLESLYNFDLLTSNAFTLEKVMNDFKGEKNIGDNIITTLDVNVQQAAYDALGEYDGAVVAIEPDTGKILAMVSKPDYNPNQIDSIWEELTAEDSTSSALVNRATQGIYTPGSTFKIFTLLEYIRENPDYSKFSYQCQGKNQTEDYSISCFDGTWHGEEDTVSAFANSCNGAFVAMGTSLNISKFQALTKEMLFDSGLPLKLPYNESHFALSSDSSRFEIAQTVIGQGKTVVTPIQMAMVAAAIENEGVLMEPYLITKIEDHNGNTIQRFKKKEYATLLSKSEAKLLKKYMKAVVTDGTGRKLQSDAYQAYGKTGTAETGDGDNAHSWFVGFATKGEKRIAIAFIMENMPPGSTWAVPATKTVFDAYFNAKS